MIDNRQTQETAEVRENSEFIKTIESFARYMHKEYIEDSDGRSLMISACDRFTDDSQGGMMHIMLGNKTMITAGLASMMRQDGLGDMFRMARIVSTDDDDMSDVINSKCHRLRKLYVISAFSALWTLCVVGFLIVGIANWITTISNLLLLTYLGFILFREIRPLRRQIARLKAADREEQEARMKHRMFTFFNEMVRRTMMNDDDDDD